MTPTDALISKLRFLAAKKDGDPNISRVSSSTLIEAAGRIAELEAALTAAAEVAKVENAPVFSMTDTWNSGDMSFNLTKANVTDQQTAAAEVERDRITEVHIERARMEDKVSKTPGPDSFHPDLVARHTAAEVGSEQNRIPICVICGEPAVGTCKKTEGFHRTAVAEVGVDVESKEAELWAEGMRHKSAIEYTIERCAQVLDILAAEPSQPAIKASAYEAGAAAIRALKDA